MQDINLGDRVRDPITGFCGIVTALTTWLNGCQRASVQPESLKDGIPQSSEHFDVPQLELVDAAVHKPVTLRPQTSFDRVVVAGTGGPPRETPGFARPAAPPDTNGLTKKGL